MKPKLLPVAFTLLLLPVLSGKGSRLWAQPLNPAPIVPGTGRPEKPASVHAWREVLSYPQPKRELGENKDVVFSLDGERLFLFGGNRDIRCLEVKTGREVLLVRDKEPPLPAPVVKPLAPLPPHLARPDREYICPTLVPVGERALSLATIWERGRQTPWGGVCDALRGERLAVLDGRGAPLLRTAAFSPDGTLLAGGDFHAAMLWDARTGRQLGRLENKQDRPIICYQKFAFSSDGARVAGGAGTTYPLIGSVAIWDVKTRKLLHVFQTSETELNAIAFSPDGTLLAGSGIHGSTVSLWDLTTGKKLAALKHDSFGQFFALAFAPDGKTLAANWRGGSRPGDTSAGVALWEVKTGRLLRVLKGCAQSVEALAFSADGRRLAAMDFNGTVKVWEATPCPSK